jgi:anti-anti-sigma regulatory factor
MQISFSTQANIGVMHLTGEVDSSNYTEVITRAQKAYDDGTRNLLLDLAQVSYVSSAGLMAFHTIARIYSGQTLLDANSGRPIFRAINPQQDAPAREHFKLLNPQAAVDQVLDVVGLKTFFEIYTDMEAALASFSA